MNQIVNGLPVLMAGKFGRIEITPDDLRRITENFRLNPGWDVLVTTGMNGRVIGKVTGVATDGETLSVDVSDTTDTIRVCRLSAEVYECPPPECTGTGRMLRGVEVLGYRSLGVLSEIAGLVPVKADGPIQAVSWHPLEADTPALVTAREG